MKITINKIAEMVGVSKSTISNYLNGNHKSMSEKTRQKIELVIAETNYRPSITAASIKTRRTRLIGVLISDISNLYSSLLLKGIGDVLHQEHYEMLIIDSSNSAAKEQENILRVLDYGADGIILQPVAQNAQEYAYLKLPVVLADRELDPPIFPVVKPDNHIQTKTLTKYAIEQGYEKCYVVTEPLKGATTRLIRYQAILDVAETSGLEVALIELGEQPFVMPKDEKKAFIFALNSKSLSIAIKEMLVSNQKEIGICGYDDWFWTDIALNGVTAIEQDPTKIGEEIAHLLLAKLNQEEVPVKTVIPTTLRIRNSL